MTENRIAIDSEIGELRRVLIHKPGQEIENMTPAMAAEVLYDDILNLPLAAEEHRQLSGVLRRFAQVYELCDLLSEVLDDQDTRGELVEALCRLYHCEELVPDLMQVPSDVLGRQLIEGTPMHKDTLEKYLSPLRHALPPLPNAFFTRDAVMCANDRVVIGSMASRVRTTEALLLRAIFRHHPELKSNGFYFDGTDNGGTNLTLEGGDLLMLRADLAVIGYSERTSVAGVDRLMEAMAREGQVRDVVVVELPKTRATIHLDMIFTMVDRDTCVVYPPLMKGARKCRAFHVRFDDGRVKNINEHPGLLEALATLDLDLTPVHCGGDDPFRQEREQWHSGANFFTLAPGRIIGYAHNTTTLDELAKHGFRIVRAKDVITGRTDIEQDGRVAVAMDGAELSRGGGGCRCMTMPIQREPVDW
jgi:arginine deiminase